MNECRKVRALLALPRADWSAAEARLVEAHLPGCAACTAAAEAYAAQDRWSRAQPPQQLSPTQRSQVLARVRAQAERPARGRLSAVLGGAGALAVVALLAISLALLFAQRAEREIGPETGQREGPAGTAETSDAAPGVAALLEHPPAAGTVVELDAYFSGADAIPMRGGPPGLPDQVACPTNTAWAAALTDRPFPAALHILNGTHSNSLPEDAAWLVATTPEATQPGQTILPQLPYLARLRGHLGDPAFAHCSNAGRIFVVEQVAATYQEQPPEPAGQAWTLPADYQAWPRYEGDDLGYSLPYPPGWTVTALDEPDVRSAVALQGPQWPGYPVVVRVHAGETYYDQYDPASVPPLLEGTGFGVYEQGWAFDRPAPESQHLSGFTVDRATGSGQGQAALLFSAHGHTYELALTYPTGFEASQSLLTTYTAMVEGFRLASPPGPTATPPINDVLGPGPFLSVEEAFDMVRARDGQDVELWDAALLPEAEARRQADACNTFTGHPDGVWRLVVRGFYEDMTRTLTLFIDAMTGEQLCGEEAAPPVQGDGSARLRVINDSPYALERVVIVFPGERIAYGPLAPGETSDYRPVRGGVYAYAAFSLVVNGQVIDQPVMDWVGEQPLPGYDFTYILSVDLDRPAMQQIQSEVVTPTPAWP